MRPLFPEWGFQTFLSLLANVHVALIIYTQHLSPPVSARDSAGPRAGAAGAGAGSSGSAEGLGSGASPKPAPQPRPGVSAGRLRTRGLGEPRRCLRRGAGLRPLRLWSAQTPPVGGAMARGLARGASLGSQRAEPRVSAGGLKTRRLFPGRSGKERRVGGLQHPASIAFPSITWSHFSAHHLLETGVVLSCPFHR